MRSRALNLLLSSKRYPTRDRIAELIGMKMQGGEWPVTEISGTLPLVYTSRTSQVLKDYSVYGTSAGAGIACESGEPDGYKIPLTNNSTDYTLYIGSSKLGAEEYVDYADGKVYKRTENLFDKDVVTPNCYIKNDGSIVTADSFSISDYTPINPNTVYTMCNATGNAPGACWYDSNKTYISGFKYDSSPITDITQTSPADAAYIRMSVRSSSPSVLDRFMLVEASTAPASYIPYLKPTDPPSPLPAISAVQGENILSSTETVGTVTVKGRIRPVIYGFHVDPTISSPDDAVTYLKDAIGKTPAAMGATTFSYGDWENAFFMPKPCMLKYDGTVDYYLDPNDYSKKADGTASDISDPTYAGNAMMEWPLIYYKFVPGEPDGEGSFYCSDHKIDDTYVCYSNYDADGNVIPHFYTAIYNGIIDGNGKMRSLSGYRLTPTIGTIAAYDNTKTYAVGALCKVSSTAYTCITPVTEAEEFDSSKWQEITPANSGGTSGSEEVTAATANNTTATVEWYTDVWADRMLINALLTLMSKSLDGQAKFGRGIDSGAQTAAEAYVTGTANDKGLFYGKTGSGDTVVKTFGMENWWACKWRRIAGLIGYTDGYKYKMNYSTVDDSTSAGYSSDGTDYLAEEITRPASQYLIKQRFGKFGVLPLQTDSSGSNSKYWAEYYYNGTGYALVGGFSLNGRNCGPWYVSFSYSFSYRTWHISGSLSCKPKKVV